MQVIIVGGGGVGYEAARSLSKKNHDVIVIEKSEKKALRFQEALDVMVLVENGASASVLEKADIKNCDILVAVTQSDETNVIVCMLAKQYGVPKTVCRIRSSGFADKDSVLSPRQLGIDVVINPEKIAAMEISKMLHFPDVSELEYFNQGRVMMLGVVVGEEAGITNTPLKKLPFNPNSILVGISDPGGSFIVPGGDDIVKPGQKIYLLGNARALKDISTLLHHARQRVQNVTILGGGMIGWQLARLLEESRNPFQVKLIEKDVTRCEKLCRDLDKTLVLEGDATEIAMLREEETETADAVIAATGDDRSNIVSALLARQFGVRKIICEVMKPQYVSVYSTLGIDSVINPRILAAARILRHTRREDIVSLSILQNEQAEVLELVLPETARVANQKLAQARFPRGMLIGSIVRGEEVIIPRGETMLLPGDHLVVFATARASIALEKYFASGSVREAKPSLFRRLVGETDE